MKFSLICELRDFSHSLPNLFTSPPPPTLALVFTRLNFSYFDSFSTPIRAIQFEVSDLSDKKKSFTRANEFLCFFGLLHSMTIRMLLARAAGSL